MTRVVVEIPLEQVAEIIALRVVAMLGPVPAQRPGSDVYVRDEAADPGDGGRRHRGPSYGAVTDDTGEVVDE